MRYGIARGEIKKKRKSETGEPFSSPCPVIPEKLPS